MSNDPLPCSDCDCYGCAKPDPLGDAIGRAVSDAITDAARDALADLYLYLDTDDPTADTAY